MKKIKMKVYKEHSVVGVGLFLPGMYSFHIIQRIVGSLRGAEKLSFWLGCFSNLWIYMTGLAMLGLVKSCIGTKFTSQFGDLIAVSILAF